MYRLPFPSFSVSPPTRIETPRLPTPCIDFNFQADTRSKCREPNFNRIYLKHPTQAKYMARGIVNCQYIIEASRPEDLYPTTLQTKYNLYPREDVHVSCLMLASHALFIACSIVGHVFLMPQTEFLNGLLNKSISTLCTHALRAVTQAGTCFCQKFRCMWSMSSEHCVGKTLHPMLSCLSHHKNKITV